MDDKLSLYMIFSLVKLLHFHLGWDAAQRALCRVGEEFIDELAEDQVICNDIDAVLSNIFEVLIRNYHVADAIDFEVASDMPVVKAAIMPPYRIYVKNCVFQDLHQLFVKYRIRRNWRRTPTGRDGMFLLCPVMNLLIHAIETKSDYLAGHCLEAIKKEKNMCTCLIDIFSRELDILERPEEENPECYRVR